MHYRKEILCKVRTLCSRSEMRASEIHGKVKTIKIQSMIEMARSLRIMLEI